MTTPAPEVRVFTPVQSTGGKAAGLLALGAVNIALLVLRFLADLRTPVGQGSPFGSAFVSAFAVIALFSIAYGIFLLLSPTRVQLDESGILLEGRLSRRRVGWNEIAQLRREETRGLWEKRTLDVLVLCDARDKKLTSVNSLLGNFPELVTEVERRSTQARGVATFDIASEIARKLKTRRRSRRVAIGAFGALTLLGLGMAVEEIYTYRQEARLTAEGVETSAQIVRHYLYNVTPRLEYSFEAPDGRSFKRDIAMDKTAWESLEAQPAIAIRYLPANPKWSHPLTGEARLEMSPAQSIVLMLAVAVLFGFLFVAVLLGYDLQTDPATGRPRLRRASEMDAEMEAELRQPPRIRPPPLLRRR